MLETPPLYICIHVVSGAIAYIYPFLVALFIIYQLIQLVFNSRFFVFTMQIKPGNSILYTLYKIAQFFVGYGLAAATAAAALPKNRRPL